MNRIPDITDLPWYTAARPYCDPCAPDVPEDNTHIDNIIELYEYSNDTIPVSRTSAIALGAVKTQYRGFTLGGIAGVMIIAASDSDERSNYK